MISFRMDEHLQNQGHAVFEVWIDGRFIASVYAVQVPQAGGQVKISIVTKHGMDATIEPDTLTETAKAVILITERPS